MKLNGRWFLQIVDRDSGNLYPIYPLFPNVLRYFFIPSVGGGGGVNKILLVGDLRRSSCLVFKLHLTFQVLFRNKLYMYI